MDIGERMARSWYWMAALTSAASDEDRFAFRPFSSGAPLYKGDIFGPVFENEIQTDMVSVSVSVPVPMTSSWFGGLTY